MAKCRLVRPYAEMSGTLGGRGGNSRPTVYGHKGQTILRRIGRPGAKDSPIQRESQAYKNDAVAQWQGLSVAQADTWREVARGIKRRDSLGQVYTMSGFAWSQSVNWWRGAIGLSLSSTSPSYEVVEPTQFGIGITKIGATVQVSILVSGVPAGTWMFIELSDPLGSQAVQGTPRMVGSISTTIRDSFRLWSATGPQFEVFSDPRITWQSGDRVAASIRWISITGVEGARSFRANQLVI